MLDKGTIHFRSLYLKMLLVFLNVCPIHRRGPRNNAVLFFFFFFLKCAITSKCYGLLCKDIYTRKRRVLYSTLQISINNNWPWEFLFTYSTEGDIQRRARKGGDHFKMLLSVISNTPPNSAGPKCHLKWAEVEAFCVCMEPYPAGRAVKCLPIPLTLGM